MRTRLWLLVLAIMLLVACGGGDGGGISSPCDLADAEMVQSVFPGTFSEGTEGQARNCDFELEGGAGISVTVFHYGSADGWESTRQGFVDNRGGVTEVDGVGESAFFPNDVGAGELVVQAGGETFSVSVFIPFEDPSPQIVDAVAGLSSAIADELGS